MASPTFTINGNPAGTSVSVSAASSVVATLSSLSGVRQVEWSITKTDDTTTPASYSLTPSGLLGSVCTLTSLGAGTSATLQCRINGGIDPQTEQPSAAMTSTAKFYVPTGGYQVLNAGELTATNVESSATHGAVKPLNDLIRAAAGLAASTNNFQKQACRLATTANHGLSGLAAIDGVTPNANDRILVKSQSTGSQNGIYVAAAGAWSRATDADTSAEMSSGLTVVVSEGTLYADTQWVLTTNETITIGATSLTFSQDTSVAEKTKLDAATESATASTLVQRGSDTVLRQIKAAVSTTTSSSAMGVELQNTTAGADGAQQYSPTVVLTGARWKSGLGAASQTVNVACQLVPVQGDDDGTSYGEYHWRFNKGAFGYSSAANLNSTGRFTAVDLVGSTSVQATSYASVGSTVASGGAVRLANAAKIVARNQANSQDIDIIASDSSDRIIIGEDTDAAAVQVRTKASGTLGFYINNVEKVRLDDGFVLVTGGEYRGSGNATLRGNAITDLVRFNLGGTAVLDIDDVAGQTNLTAARTVALQATGGYCIINTTGGGNNIYVDSSAATIFRIGGYDKGQIDNSGVWHVGDDADTTNTNLRLNGGTQSTVGAAGGASALPATPTGYAKVNINGTVRVIPYYAQA